MELEEARKLVAEEDAKQQAENLKKFQEELIALQNKYGYQLTAQIAAQPIKN